MFCIMQFSEYLEANKKTYRFYFQSCYYSEDVTLVLLKHLEEFFKHPFLVGTVLPKPCEYDDRAQSTIANCVSLFLMSISLVFG